MKSYRIFVDFVLPADAVALLREGTAGHQLIFPEKPIASILADAQRDPQFETAEIAFGQPDPGAVAESTVLQWIHISTSGITRYDNADFRAIVARKKIPVSNSAGVYNEACAAQALSFMLAQARNLPAALKTRTANGTPAWNALRASTGTLRGERVLILGYGAIGRRLAELLRPFEMAITAFRRQPRGDEGVAVVGEDQLVGALGAADHVVNILPDNPASRRFCDQDRFAALKRGAVFYNIGRGATVDQAALLAALRSGQLGAAWLDVTDPEPLPEDHPLLAQPNCFITPHTAGGHAGEAKTLVRHFLKNLERFANGEPLLDRIM